MPFLLFPKQFEWVRWVLDLARHRESGLTEKSRDCGISWLAIATAVSLCLFRRNLTIGFGSAKEDKIDRSGDPDSLFWKARTFLQHLPPEFRGGWDEAKHSAHMRLVFPESACAIVGEAGDNIGRGGRAQPLDAKVLTPTGWRAIGDLVRGDRILGSNGTPTVVTGVYDRGVREVYRVRFSDGSSTRCCDEHLWRVTTAQMRKAQRRVMVRHPRAPRFAVLDLASIRKNLHHVRRDSQTQWRYHIPMLSAPIQFDAVDLPLDPYLVGCILGNGAIAHIDRASPDITFHEDDTEMIGYINERLSENCEARRRSDTRRVRAFRVALVDKRARGGRRRCSPIKEALRRIGIAGMGSHTKRIPEIYKRGTPEQRLELVRGLMDTDGWVHSKGRSSARPRFSSVSRGLVADLTEIIQSLGGTTRMTERVVKAGRVMANGHPLPQTLAYELTLCLPDGMLPFRLRRKAERVTPRLKYKPQRSIVAVESVGQAATRCIRVAADDHLYVTDDCILTHNSSIYFVDEAAHIDRPKLIEASLASNTDCRIDISSVAGMANPFAEKRHSGRIKVFTFSWRDDPRKGEELFALPQEKCYRTGWLPHLRCYRRPAV